jgi:hypothetical protein
MLTYSEIATTNSLNKLNVPSLKGRVVAKEVTIRSPIAAARVPAQVMSCGICDGQSHIGAGFSVLQFPLPLIPASPHSSLRIIRSW